MSEKTEVTAEEEEAFLQVSDAFFAFTNKYGPKSGLVAIETMAKAILHFDYGDNPAVAFVIARDFNASIIEYIERTQSQQPTTETIQ